MSVFRKNRKDARLFRAHLQEVLVISGASYVSHVNILLDQLFVGRLGSGYLNFHIFVASLGLVAFTLGRALGNAVLVTSGKERAHDFIRAGFLASLMLAGAASAILLALQENFLKWGDLPKSDAQGYYLIFVLINACDIIKSVASAAMVRLSLHQYFVRLAVLSLVVNLVVSGTMFWVYEDRQFIFFGIGVGTLLATLIPLCASLRLVSRRIPAGGKIKGRHFRRLWQTFRGEGVYLLTLGHLPLLTIAVMQKFYGVEVVNVYGTVQRVCALLMAPWHISVTQAVKNVTSGERRGEGAGHDHLGAAERVAWLLSGLPLILAAIVMMQVYGAENWPVWLLAAALPARQLLQVLSLRDVVIARVHEVSERIAAAEVFWSGGVCCLILWYAAIAGARSFWLSGAFLISGAGFIWSLRLMRPKVGAQGGALLGRLAG